MHIHKHLPETKCLIALVNDRPFYASCKPICFICPKCRKSIVKYPEGIIPRLKIHIDVLICALRKLAYMPIYKVAMMIGIKPHTLSNILEYIEFDTGKDVLASKEEIILKIDEFYWKKRKACIVITEKNGDIVAMLPEKKSVELKGFMNTLGERTIRRIKWIVVDMDKVFKGVLKWLNREQGVGVIVDRFHVIRYLWFKLKESIEIINVWRQDEGKNPLNSRLFREKMRHIPPWMERIFKEHRELGDEWRFYQKMLEIYRAKYKYLAEKMIGELMSWAKEKMQGGKHINLREMVGVVERWREWILNYFEGRETNGGIEAKNRVINDVVRVSYGFNRWESYKVRVYLRLGAEPRIRWRELLMRWRRGGMSIGMISYAKRLRQVYRLYLTDNAEVMSGTTK